MKLPTATRVIVLACVVLICASSAMGQTTRRSRPDRDTSKRSNTLKKAFSEVTEPLCKSTVVILCEGRQTALGAVVDSSGWIITKASELRGEPSCKFADGSVKPAKVVGIADDVDVALLKVQADKLVPVTWETEAPVRAGQWVAACGIEPLPVSVGVVSVVSYKASNRTAVMGVMLEDAEDGVTIASVLPNGGAKKAGILAKDVILSVDDTPTPTRESVTDAIGRHKPGEQVKLRIRRGDEEKDVDVTLGRRPVEERSQRMNNMGKVLSERSTGFGNVIAHDTYLAARDCGGPLVNTDGKVIGINIAAHGRIDSYALPAETVLEVLPDLMSGKLAPPATQPTTQPATQPVKQAA